LYGEVEVLTKSAQSVVCAHLTPAFVVRLLRRQWRGPASPLHFASVLVKSCCQGTQASGNNDKGCDAINKYVAPGVFAAGGVGEGNGDGQDDDCSIDVVQVVEACACAGSVTE